MVFSPTTKRVIATWIIVALLGTQLVNVDLSQSQATEEHLNVVALLVDEDVYSNTTNYVGLDDEHTGLQTTTLKARIDRYAENVQGVMPMTKVLIVRTQPDEDPANIVQALEKLYFEGDGSDDRYTELSGVILVGNIPIPVVTKNDNRYLSLYPYTDFEDRVYLYNAGTGDFERSPQVDNPQPEVWQGVIRAPSTGEEGNEQLAEYFDKNYLYRQGYEEFIDFDQKLFYADTIAEEKALNRTGIEAYERFIDHWEDISYYRYTSDLARELYEEVFGSVEGGDDEDNDSDSLTDEDPVNGYDDDGDGLTDEDDGNFDYGIDTDRDCWDQDASDWDSNGDGRDCYVGDDYVDEDGTEDNNNDGDLATDEDVEGDDNEDGCSGKCDTDDDGDQADWDNDEWPNGFEEEVLNSDEVRRHSPFWYKARSLPSDEQDILNEMYTDEEYPTYDPYCFSPYMDSPLPSEYFDGTLTFVASSTDRNGDRCRASACESDMSNDDDEDGLCDEDTENDNDADGDGEIDEDRAGDPDGGGDMFEELPDIQSKMVVDSFFKKYPELFRKYIGNLNVWTDYTGRYQSSYTDPNGNKVSDRETFMGLIGQRDDYTLKVMRAVNDLLEASIDDVVDNVAHDIPILGRITITGEVIDEDTNSETFTYEFINHAVRQRFWYPDQIYINGNSADEITSVSQCSIYRGSYDEGGENQLVKGLRVYDYTSAGDYDEDGEPYGGCFGNFADTPEYCFPELAENPVRSKTGTLLTEDEDIHVDYRSCYNFKESEEFLGTSYSASDSSYSTNVEGYWYYAKELLQNYSDLLEDLDEGNKDDGDDMDGDGDYDEDDFELEVEEIEDDLDARDAYNIPVKDPDDIYLFGEQGDTVYYTFGAFLEALDVNKDSQEEIGGFFADNTLTFSFTDDQFDDIDTVELDIEKEYVKEDGSFLSSNLTTNSSEAYTISSVLKHVEPTVGTINQQTTAGFSESLPVDSPRFTTFQDTNYEYAEIVYPNVFEASSWEEFQALLEVKEDEIVTDIPGASTYDGFLTDLIDTEIFEGQMEDVFAWYDMNIDEKHLWTFENYLNPEAVPYVGESAGYETLYLVADGEADHLDMSFYGNTVEEDPDIEFNGTGETEEVSAEDAAAAANDEGDYDADDPNSGHISWFPFIWIYDIVQWVDDLSTTVSNQASAVANGELELSCGSDSAGLYETDTDYDGIPDDEDSAPYSMDDDGDGVPDGAADTVSLSLEWEENRVLYANGADMFDVTVNALDASGNVNTGDGYSQVTLEVVSGEDSVQLLTVGDATLIDGETTLRLSTTMTEGTFVIRALGTSDNLSGVSSNTLSFTSKTQHLKLSTYEKEFITENITYSTETLEDVLILDEAENVIAVVRAEDGDVSVLDENYRLEARTATATTPTRLVIIENATETIVSEFYLFPDTEETVIESSVAYIRDTVNNVRVVDSNPSDDWSANYGTDEGGTIVLYNGTEPVGLVDPDGSIFLKPELVLTLEPSDPYVLVDNIHLHFTVNLGENVLFDIVMGSETSLLEMLEQDTTAFEAPSRGPKRSLWKRFVSFFIQPVQAASQLVDSDGDALDDLSEWTIGTNLYDVDTDGDGYADSIELDGGYNPLGEGRLFTDFFADSEGYSAVVELFTRGIIKGYSDGSFKPDKSITREEFTKLNLGAVCIDCTQFTETAQQAIEEEYGDHAFPDTNIAEDLYYCVAHSRNEELISGYKAGTHEGYYLPQNSMSRAEATKVLLETAGISVDDVTDLTRPWYFNHIVEAQATSLYPEGRFTALDTYDSSEFSTWLANELSENGPIRTWLEAPITREEFSMMVNNLLRVQDCSLDDADGDGLPDNAELYNYGTSPYNADTDYGGVDDFTEVVNDTNAVSDPSDDDAAAAAADNGTSNGDNGTDGDGTITTPADATTDSDGDHLTDVEEAYYGADPFDPDTDDGGVSDFEEVMRGTDPLNPDDDYEGLENTSGAYVAGSNLSRDLVYQTETISDDVLFERNVFTKLVPADGTSQLYLRATILDANGKPIAEDNASIVEFIAVDPAYPFAEILREQVRVTDGIAETEILASTTSGYFAVTAQITPSELPVIDTEVYVYPGDPYHMTLSSDSEFLKSGGLNSTNVTLSLYDIYDNVANMSPQTVTLTVDGPVEIDDHLDEDLEQVGTQITLYEGFETFDVISGEEEGIATITATLGTVSTTLSLGVYDDIAIELYPANESLTANGTSTTTVTAWAILNDSGAPLLGFNGDITFAVVDDLYGTLEENVTVTMTDGQADIDFTTSTLAGIGYITASMIGFEPSTVGIDLLPGEATTLELSSNSTVVNANESVEVYVKAYDVYENFVYTDSSTEVALRVTEQGSSFGNLEDSAVTLSEGMATVEVTGSNLTGPINLVASADGLTTATLTIDTVLQVEGPDMEAIQPNALFVALLGAPFGEVTQEDYFGGWFTFNGKTEASVSLLSDPNPNLRLAGIDSQGKVSVLDGNAVDIAFAPANSRTLPNKFFVKDLLTQQTIAEGTIVPSSSDFYVVDSTFDLAEAESDGFYIQLLSQEDRYEMKNSATRVLPTAEGKISLLENNNEIVRFEEDGQVQIYDSNYSLTINENYESFTFDVILADTPIARVLWKQTFDQDVTELDSHFSWDTWTLLSPGVYYTGVQSETYGFATAYSGNSSANPKGMFVVDKTQELPTKQKPGLGFSSLESAETEPGVGFQGDNKFMLSLSDGLTVGEANQAYASDIGIVLGDPTIRLTDVNELDVSETGFTSGIGRMVLAGNEVIQDISIMDYNSDGMEDVVVAFESGMIDLLENTNSYPRLKNRGDLLNITNGIIAMAQGDFNQDGQMDLVVATEEACIEGEICIYLYTNYDSNFVRENLDLELEGDGQTIKQILAEDLNQDDYPDLVLSDMNGSIHVFYNDEGTLLTTGDEVGNLGLQVDDSMNLIEEVLLNYEDMPTENSRTSSDDGWFKDFPVPVTGGYDSALSSKFGDIDPSFATGGFSTDFIGEIIGPMTDGSDSALQVTLDEPQLQENVTYIYADSDEDFSGSSKTAEDVNGEIVEDGDVIEYRVTIENGSAYSVTDLSFTDVVSSLLDLDWDSFECSGSGCGAMTVSESGISNRPFVVSGLQLGAGDALTITYQAEVSGMQIPTVNLIVGQDLDSTYTDDNYLDIGASPEDNPSGQMVFFYSNGTYSEDSVTKINYTKQTSAEEEPVDLSSEFEDIGIDWSDLDEDGNPMALHMDEDAEEPPEAVNAPYEEVAHSSSEDDLNQLWSNVFVPVDDPSDIMTNVTAGVATAGATIAIADEVISEVADGMETILTQFLCSGGCIASPINYAALVPGPINVFGIPVVVLDPLHIPVFAAPVPSIWPVWPITPAWQASTAVRIYASVTLTLGFTISVCVGPYLGGQCWTVAIPLFEALGVCDAVNGAISSAISSAGAAIKKGSNTLLALGGGGGQSSSGRSESGGMVNYNLGSYLVTPSEGTGELVEGFPKPFAGWLRKQMEEVKNKLTDFSDIYLLYPDPSSFVGAFVPDSTILEDADLRGMEKILSFMNSFPLLNIETKEVTFKFPSLTKDEIEKFVLELTTWKDYHVNQWEMVKENWVGEEYAEIRGEMETLFRDVEKNIEILEDYKDFPRELLNWRYVEAFYIKQIICYLDTIINYLGGWVIKNKGRIEDWIQAVYDVIEAFKSWKLIFDLAIDYQESCDQCKNQRLSLFELLAKLFVFIPEPPIIELPAWPDIVLDFSQIQLGLTILWPEVKFVPEPLLIPSIPTFTIPALPTLDLDLPTIPLLPELPALPELPTLPGIPLPDLPDLPPPPEIPELSASIQIMLKIASSVMKIICLIQSGILPTSEVSLKTQVENITQRPLSPVLPIDLSITFPSLNIGKDFVDVIEVVAVLNLNKALEFDGLVEIVETAAELSNSIVTDLVDLANQGAQSASDLVQSGSDAVTDTANTVTDTEVEVDLDSDASTTAFDENALLTETAWDLLENPALSPYLSQWNTEVSRMEDQAALQADLNAAIPDVYTLTATQTYITLSDEEVEAHFEGVEDRYYANDLSTMDGSPLPGLRNDLIGYFLQEQDQTELLAAQLDGSTDDWDIMTRWIASTTSSSFSPTESRLLVSRDDSPDGSHTLYSTANVFEATHDALIEEFSTTNGQTVVESSLENMEEVSHRYFADTTAEEASAAMDAARTAPEVTNVGLFLYNEVEEVNERLIDYTAESDGETHLAFVDIENDGDDDIVYAVGGNIYFKENYTEYETPDYYDRDAEIVSLEDLLPEAPVVDLFAPTDSDNEIASIAWKPAYGDLLGYEMRSYESLTDFENEEPEIVHWDHFLSPNDGVAPSLGEVSLEGEVKIGGTAYSEETISTDALANGVIMETEEGGEIELVYDTARITLAENTRFPVPDLTYTGVSLEDADGNVTLNEDQLLRTIIYSSGETTAQPGDLLHALEDSTILLTFEEETGETSIELPANAVFTVSTLYTDAVTVRVDDGSVELIGQETSDEVQTLSTGMLLLSGEIASFDNEITVQVFSSEGSFSTTYGGPAHYSWHSISNPDAPRFDLSRENGEYYATLRGIQVDGARGTWGSTILLSPQICGDDEAPYANIGSTEEEVSVFKTLTLDGGGSFDSSSDLLQYWWDTDLETDDDGDGDPTNDADYYGDTDPLTDEDGNGSTTDDWDDTTLPVGPYDTLETRPFKLWVSDEAGNASGAEATVNVYVPAISLSASSGRSGSVEGSIDPVDENIPFVLVRERDGVYDLITTPSADENSKYYTDENGEFVIDDLELSETWVVYNDAYEAVAEIDLETGSLTLLMEGYTVDVYSAELPWPTRAVLLDPDGDPIVYVFFVPDSNVDVQIDVTSLQYTAENTADMVGVHVKSVGLPESLDLETIPANEPLFTGGVAIVNQDNERLAVIDTDGNIYRLSDLELDVLDVTTVNESADEEDASPIVITLGEGDRTWLEIYIATNDSAEFTTLAALNLEDEISSLLQNHDLEEIATLDSDGDGITDLEELRNGLNPYDASDADNDADGDGLSNGEEDDYGTTINDPDADGDGFTDYEEVSSGNDPLADAESMFDDISADDPYYQDILDMVSFGIVEGYSEDGSVSFKPDQFITRAEYAKILLAILCITPRDEAYEAPNVFNDILDPALWYYSITKESYLQTFITGYLGEVDEDGMAPFKPDITISRAEGTKIILEALETLDVIDMGEVPVGEPWYLPYIDIAQDLTPYFTGDALGDGEAYIITEEEVPYATAALTRYDFVVMATRVLDFYNCYALQDSDGDGLSDYDEVTVYHTDLNDPDTDGGGITDGDEVNGSGETSTDPNDRSDDDSDEDGLVNADETNVYGTDPNVADTDGGGTNDGVEVVNGTDPVDSATDDGAETASGTDESGIDTEEELEESVLEEENVLDGLDPGLYIVTEECNTCPCDVTIENTADISEGDSIYAAIMDTDNAILLSISNGVSIEELTGAVTE